MPNPIRRIHGIFRAHAISVALAVLAAACLAGCNQGEKGGKELDTGKISPPWDSPAFHPKHLDGFAYEGPESLFTIFKDIAFFDSLAGDASHWKPENGAVDTLTLAQLFDSAFVFPPTPEAAMPYAYDDSYRDDTLYRNTYGNGLYSQDHPCASTYVLTAPFVHPARWIKAGYRQGEIISALGMPLYRTPGALRYLTRLKGKAPEVKVPSQDSAAGSHPNEYEIFDVYEAVNFYFRDDSLFAAVLQRSQPCH